VSKYKDTQTSQEILDAIADMRKYDGDAQAPGASDKKYDPHCFHDVEERIKRIKSKGAM
jgi:hypothetical protein